MCDLMDVRYYERHGDDLLIYDLNEYGNATACVRVVHRFEARNLEQWIQHLIDDTFFRPPDSLTTYARRAPPGNDGRGRLGERPPSDSASTVRRARGRRC